MPRYLNIVFIWLPLALIILVVFKFVLSDQSRHDPAIWIQASCAFGLSMGTLLTTFAHRAILRSAQRSGIGNGQASSPSGISLVPITKN
jgi:RsiW-degrading membrane proteinase PrsW (M82 family)